MQESPGTMGTPDSYLPRIELNTFPFIGKQNLFEVTVSRTRKSVDESQSGERVFTYPRGLTVKVLDRGHAKAPKLAFSLEPRANDSTLESWKGGMFVTR